MTDSATQSLSLGVKFTMGLILCLLDGYSAVFATSTGSIRKASEQGVFSSPPRCSTRDAEGEPRSCVVLYSYARIRADRIKYIIVWHVALFQDELLCGRLNSLALLSPAHTSAPPPLEGQRGTCFIDSKRRKVVIHCLHCRYLPNKLVDSVRVSTSKGTNLLPLCRWRRNVPLHTSRIDRRSSIHGA